MQVNLVSIIIPIHNGEKYIVNLLDKILSNPCQNFEILLGDDASTDNTSQILNHYSQDSRIKIFKSSLNIGAGAMRNKLLKMSTGQFIAIQDVDDLFDESRFIKQVDFLNRNPGIDVVGTEALLVDKGREWGTISVSENPNFINWFMQNSMVHASIMFRRSICTDISYGEEMRFGEDYYFLTTLFLKGFKFSNIKEALYFYNISEAELKSRSRKYFFEILHAKLKIANLVPFYIRPFFISFHFVKLLLSASLSAMRASN